jgi:phage terminase large subunit
LNESLSNLRIETAAVCRPLLAKAKYRGAFGGRGSGKSHFFFAGLVIEEYLSEPGSLVVCIRETQRTLATLLNVRFWG